MTPRNAVRQAATMGLVYRLNVLSGRTISCRKPSRSSPRQNRASGAPQSSRTSDIAILPQLVALSALRTRTVRGPTPHAASAKRRLSSWFPTACAVAAQWCLWAPAPMQPSRTSPRGGIAAGSIHHIVPRSEEDFFAATSEWCSRPTRLARVVQPRMLTRMGSTSFGYM